MSIHWKKGTQWKCDAGKAHEEFEKIRKQSKGEITPKKVVERASRPRSPLHQDFEWDDAAAADEYRCETARRMLRSLVIVREEIKTDRPQRCYEASISSAPRQPGRPKKVYKSMDDIMSDEDLRADLIARALRELIAIRNRYRDLVELSVVLRAIDETVEELGGEGGVGTVKV